MSDLLQTPLTDWHRQAGARLVPFGGYEMPVRYGSQVDEHHAVRRAAGLFDVSHMGEFTVRGPGAVAFVQYATPNNVSRLKVGRAHYSALLDHDGHYLDDLLVYRRGEEDLLLVVNAAGRADDLAHLQALAEAWAGDPFELEDRSDSWGLIAVQGPRSLEVVQAALAGDLAATLGIEDAALGERLGAMAYYSFFETPPATSGAEATIWSRTGYTGEFGFELYVPAQQAPVVWQALLEAGETHGIVPAGLGARDTLRLEAGMHLSGQDLDGTVSPLEVGLAWTVKFKAGDFVGRDALVRQREEGLGRRMVGFELDERGIARHGDDFSVELEGGQLLHGRVTSGTWSPTLEKAIGLARIEGPAGFPAPATGSACSAKVRNREIAGRLVDLPFYRPSGND